MASASFTQEEAELVQDTAKIALANAAKSFGKMLQDDMELEHLALHLAPSDKVKSLAINEENYFVLQTDVVGELKAKSYLIFSYDNAAEACQILLPSSLVGNPEMREAMLLEVDNIVAASVVTKYADILNRQITGHVPEILRYDRTKLKNIISEGLQESPDFSFTVSFKGVKSNITAEFVCFFTDMFSHTISECAPLAETSQMVEANKSDSDLASILGKVRNVINRILGG